MMTKNLHVCGVLKRHHPLTITNSFKILMSYYPEIINYYWKVH